MKVMSFGITFFRLFATRNDANRLYSLELFMKMCYNIYTFYFGKGAYSGTYKQMVFLEGDLRVSRCQSRYHF